MAEVLLLRLLLSWVLYPPVTFLPVCVFPSAFLSRLLGVVTFRLSGVGVGGMSVASLSPVLLWPRAWFFSDAVAPQIYSRS